MNHHVSSASPPRWHIPSLVRRRSRGRRITTWERQVRLLRWASLLERNPYQVIGLLSPSWAGGDAGGAMADWPSAIDIASDDIVLRVMGLAGRSPHEAKTFFGLSDTELDRIVSGPRRFPVRPAWQVAIRIRNVARPRLENQIVGVVLVFILVFCAALYWIVDNHFY